ncbi:MAG TPA: acyltransferase [Paraburkholderia sp.]|jgi:peptidoglycan/LPS O-acetylase OafA/YrhL|nr:acyltransferase [Paraburkholderia sp.]
MKRWLGKRSSARGRTVELDFLRGIAIIVVMGYHFHTVHTGNPVVGIIEYPLTNFGREGVNLFFTLSGFLVGGLLLRQYSLTGRIAARRFVVRRIFKIWPAYYALILFHALAGRHPLDTFLWQNLSHLQNYYTSSIVQTWSLAVEEHFYLLLPAMLLLLVRWRAGANTIIGVIVAICVAVLAARSVAVLHGHLIEAFSYTQYRLDSLLFGVLLATVYWMKPDVYRRIAARPVMLGAAVLLLLAWLVCATPYEALDWSIGLTLQPIGYCALIVLVLEHSKLVSGTLCFRLIAWTGLYSYGIYLWHSLAFAPGDFVIHKATVLGLPTLAVWALSLAVQFAVAIGLGYLTTRAVEYPFLRLRDSLFPERRMEVPAPGGNVTAVEGQLSSAASRG